MARQRIINYHTSGTTAPLSEDIYYGELVVSHNSIGNTKIYTKVTNPSGDTNEGKIATFIDEPQIDEKISNSVNGLADIVQNLANLTITDIQATTPINATEKAIVAESCGNTVTISHVADKTEQSGFKKLTTDTYGHVTGGEDVVIGDISGLTGFGDAIKGAETKLAYSSEGTGNAVTSISVNDHTITANFGKEFSEAGHTHAGSDITSGKVGIDYLPTSTAVTSTSDDTTIPTSKAVHDAVSGTVNGLKKEASSAQGQFVRTVIQENGLVSESKDFINVNDVKLSAVTPLSTTVKEEYALYNGNGVQLGDSIKIYKDSALKEVYLGHSDDALISENGPEHTTGTGETALCFIYYTVEGKYQLVAVNVQSFLEESEFKDGLSVENHEVKVKIDSTSESFLTVGEQGVKLSGVQDAINSAIGGVNTKLQELSGSVKTLSSTTESFSAATVAEIAGLDTKIDNETARATAAENSISANVTTLSSATESFSAATVAEIARVEGKLSDDEKVIAESINQLRTKVDKVQEGAGLNGDGSYAPHSTANYIAAATSLDDADMKLDSAVKALADSMTGSTADINELSGQVQTLSGSVVNIENREQNYASAITINGNKHTVVNNGVDLGSYLSANTTYVKAVSQANNQWTGDTSVVEYVTTTFTMQDGTTFSINSNYNIIDGGSY